ncbi:MAG TPA: hypothetical protein VFG01_04555 [Acidobacteriota bacterium]|nr:hypothetical protein [Acidobacteriota bacterium]
MKKSSIFLFVILICWLGLAINCKKEETQSNSTNFESFKVIFSENILKQKKSDREFSSSHLELIKEINIENLEKPLYRPVYLRFDEKGCLYTLDFFEFLIHKFSSSSNWEHYNHSFFGKGRGQGPGEFSRVLDFKIFKDEVYLVDEGTGSIEVYSTDGIYKKRISLSNHMVPRKITIQDSRIIVQSLIPEGPLFFVYDLYGESIFSFGELINKSNVENTVYHDNELSNSFSGDCFYYLPRFFGYVCLYKGDRLAAARETIDGLEIGKKNVPVKKIIMKNAIARTVNKKYETVLLHSLYNDFILIKTFDYVKKNAFWDIYDLQNFEYIISIRNPPPSASFAMYRNYLAVLSDTETGSKIEIFDISEVLREARARMN